MLHVLLKHLLLFYLKKLIRIKKLLSLSKIFFYSKYCCNLIKQLDATMTFKPTFYYIVVYVQVRFELIYVSEISYLIVYLH